MTSTLAGEPMARSNQQSKPRHPAVAQPITLIKLTDLCCRYGISERTYWRDTGSYPRPIRIKGRLRFSAAEVDADIVRRLAERGSTP